MVSLKHKKKENEHYYTTYFLKNSKLVTLVNEQKELLYSAIHAISIIFLASLSKKSLYKIRFHGMLCVYLYPF